MGIYEILTYVGKVYILASSDVLVWGNTCQFSDEVQESVQLWKRRVIPVSSSPGLPGSGSAHRSKGRPVLRQLFF